MLVRSCLIFLLVIAIGILSLVLAPRFLPEDNALAKEGHKAAEKVRNLVTTIKEKSSELLKSEKEPVAVDGFEESEPTNTNIDYPVSRTIKNKDGQKIAVKVTKINDEEIVFVKEGTTKIYRYPMKDLSISDQEFFMNLMNGKGSAGSSIKESDPFE